MDRKIVTAFSADGYHQYGKRFLDSYDAPFDLELYVEGLPVGYVDAPVVHNQMEIPGLLAFLRTWATDKRVAGREAIKQWNDKERRAGYSYRFDAYKFCRMVYTMWDAARDYTGLMIWLDGDSVIRQRLPDDFFERYLPDDCAYAYLGREPKHTETGFLIFRLPDAMPILQLWRDFYDSEEFLNFKEWHSAYLFDRAREQFPDIKGNNLTPGGRGHVIHKCEVGSYIDHLKGNRKNRGRSPEARR